MDVSSYGKLIRSYMTNKRLYSLLDPLLFSFPLFAVTSPPVALLFGSLAAGASKAIAAEFGEIPKPIIGSALFSSVKGLSIKKLEKAIREGKLKREDIAKKISEDAKEIKSIIKGAYSELKEIKSLKDREELAKKIINYYFDIGTAKSYLEEIIGGKEVTE